MHSASFEALAGAAAEAIAFSAAAPLLPGGLPSVVRVCLAISLIPILAQTVQDPQHASAGEALATGAIEGAIFGVSASLVAAAVKGAGGAIDATLGSPPFLAHEGRNGVLERLYELAFAITLLASGGFATLILSFVHADRTLLHKLLDPHEVVALAGLSLREGFVLAGPCLFAQGLATITAGILARVAPALSGVQFGTSLSSTFALLALSVGAGTLVPELAGAVRETLAALSRVR
jgi:flagellar biosynthesis protein FliR